MFGIASRIAPGTGYLTVSVRNGGYLKKNLKCFIKVYSIYVK